MVRISDTDWNPNVVRFSDVLYGPNQTKLFRFQTVSEIETLCFVWAYYMGQTESLKSEPFCSNFRHLHKMSEIWTLVSISDTLCVWKPNTQKFRFQTFTVVCIRNLTLQFHKTGLVQISCCTSCSWAQLLIILFQIFCDESKKAKLHSDFRHLSGCLLHGENEVEIELEGLAEFLKVKRK